MFREIKTTFNQKVLNCKFDLDCDNKIFQSVVQDTPVKKIKVYSSLYIETGHSTTLGSLLTHIRQSSLDEDITQERIMHQKKKCMRVKDDGGDNAAGLF